MSFAEDFFAADFFAPGLAAVFFLVAIVFGIVGLRVRSRGLMLEKIISYFLAAGAAG